MEHMPFPTLEHSSASIRDSDADILILALPPTDDPPAEIDGFPGLAAALTAVGFTGSAGSVHRVQVADLPDRPVAVVGTGAEPTADAVRDAVGAALRTLTGFSRAAVAVPGADAATQRAAAEGATLGGYWFDDY
jgi:leucyl aminopeptidase